MGFGQELLIQFGVVFVAAGLAFLVVFLTVVRPFLNRRVEALQRAGEQMEARVAEGVRAGIEQSLHDLPESALKESASSFRRMGTGLVENGLSTFLGRTAERPSHREPPEGSQ